MARIAGVNIPTNKRVVIALQYIHGIGPKSAKDIVGKVGIEDAREGRQPLARAAIRSHWGVSAIDAASPIHITGRFRERARRTRRPACGHWGRGAIRASLA